MKTNELSEQICQALGERKEDLADMIEDIRRDYLAMAIEVSHNKPSKIVENADMLGHLRDLLLE